MLCCCMSLFQCGLSKSKPSQLEIKVHSYGNISTIDPTTQKGQDLIASVESSIKMSNSILRLAVGKQTIRSLKKSGLSIEFIYRKEVQFAVSELGKTFTIDRILIPLSGSLSGAGTTIFYGKKKYLSGPLVTSIKSSQIQSILDQ